MAVGRFFLPTWSSLSDHYQARGRHGEGESAHCYCCPCLSPAPHTAGVIGTAMAAGRSRGIRRGGKGGEGSGGAGEHGEEGKGKDAESGGWKGKFLADLRTYKSPWLLLLLQWCGLPSPQGDEGKLGAGGIAPPP